MIGKLPIALARIGSLIVLGWLVSNAGLDLCRVAHAAERPNFVLIIADDLGCDDTGPYGNRGVRTPALDRLAAGGLLFQNAVLTCSSCSPSRSSIITCRYPHNTGAEQLHWPLPKDQITFVELLKGAELLDRRGRQVALGCRGARSLRRREPGRSRQCQRLRRLGDHARQPPQGQAVFPVAGRLRPAPRLSAQDDRPAAPARAR